MSPAITQRTFIKGLDASTDRFDQIRGSLPQLSNMIFSRRGALLSIDGSRPLQTTTSQLTPAANKGAIVAIQQYLSGSVTATSSPGGGGNVTHFPGSGVNKVVTPHSDRTVWDNPGNICADDSAYASSTFFSGLTSYLQASQFGFNIPTGATIVGIKASIDRCSLFAGTGQVQDSVVQLVKNGVIVGANLATGAAWPDTSDGSSFPFGVADYGGNGIMWGITLSVAEANSAALAGFGAVLRAQGVGIAGRTKALVQYIKLELFYTGGGGSGVSSQVGQAILYLQDSDVGAQLAEVTGLTLTGINVGGGTLTPGTTYTYAVGAFDGQQNSSAGVSASLVLPGGMNAIRITWDVEAGAGSYMIWGRTSPLGAFLFAQVPQPDFVQPVAGATVTYTDVGGTPPGLINLPYGLIEFGVNNTIGPLRLFILKSISPVARTFSDPQLLGLFPSRASDASIPNIPPVDSVGGLLGASGQIPQMIQFADVMIIALGNGWRPQYTDGGSVFPFTNTFTAQYIFWAASTTFLVGDIVQPNPANSHYYKCTQGGQTGAMQPTFPTTTGAAVTDGQAVWVEAGLVTASPPPRGAAHVVNHAGALWFWNTQPQNSSDNLDGPSVLGMSDVNNVHSFNPINRTFIGKDDGSEGMGLASFTIAELGIAPLGSLIAFKNFSAYQIVGVFGAQDFTIQQIQSDMGCVAPRSILFVTGYGIARMSHLGFAMFDGVRDKLISEQIRPYIFGSPSTGRGGLPSITPVDLNHMYLIKSAQLGNPPMYLAAAPLKGNVSLSRVFMYDLVLRAWSILDLPTSILPTSYISSIYQVRTPGLDPITVVGGYDSGSIQIIEDGDGQWQLGPIPVDVQWAFTTPEVFNTQDPTAPITIDTVMIRGINRTGSALSVTVNLQTEEGFVADPKSFPIGLDEFELFVGVQEVALSANALIAGTGQVEILSVVWNVKPEPGGVPWVIT